jgi:hypothetical protein
MVRCGNVLLALAIMVETAAGAAKTGRQRDRIRNT